MNDPIERLNKLLQIELAAVSTYRRMVPHIRNQHFQAVAQHCYDLHVQAGEKLKQRLHALGSGYPEHASIWAALAAIAAEVATVFGDQAIRSSLQKKELERLEVYEYELTCLDAENLRLVQEELIEIQESICTCLKGVQL
jgi:bacterioferritin (cytochrome b1)